ncbi:MAG: PAS domain S-box protein [Actinomycetota bacterium]|nr:PAS domain S-box protein [Actinomycetota bacterium]
MASAESTRREQEQFQLAFEHAPIGMALVSPAGRFTKVNAAMCRITGYSEPELLARSIAEITHPDDVADGAARVQKLLSGAIGEYQAEKRYIRPDGSVVTAIVSRSLLRDDAGNPEQLVSHVIDITEQKRMEQELARSNADLADFAYLAAHDLKSPLQAIFGFATLLSDAQHMQLDDRARECVGWILDGAARMNALIDDLLAFCRVNIGDPVMVEVDLDEVVRAVMAEIKAGPDAIVTAADAPKLIGDPVQFHELLLNLVSNAIKFIDEGVTPRVHISAARVPEGWQLSVADNGIGIEPAQRGRIFGMFNRLHSRERYPGTGIGLAICERIVERRGGTIWVEEIPSGGTRFCFTVPDAVL